MEQYRSDSSLLTADEKGTSHGMLCSRCEERLTGSKKRFSQVQMLLLFGAIQLALGVVGFACFGVFFLSRGREATGLNDYLELAQYNITRKHFDIMNAADPSPEADDFWRHTTRAPGIVAVDGQWAQDMGLPSSVPHPDDARMALYQVNGFHSLHCLYRIRNRLIAEVPLDQWPRNDFHTMHCLDHIRKDLMCNADITLRGSENYVDFGVQARDGAQCRDLDAIHRWAERHAYSDFGEFLDSKLNYDPVKVEKEVQRQRLVLEHERHEKIPWDKADFTYNNVTGEITLVIL